MDLRDNIKVSISPDRNLEIKVDLSEYNHGSETMVVGEIRIFNTKSWLSGVEIMAIGSGSVMAPPDWSNFTITLSEQNLNQYDVIHHQDECYTTDLLNDIIIVEVTRFDYSAAFVASHPCCDTPSGHIVAIYYPCPIYARAMGKLGNQFGTCQCDEEMPYGFINELLKKKAVDASLECGDYDTACQHYMKFYRNDPCDCSCNGRSAGATSATSRKRTSNCGCHG